MGDRSFPEELPASDAPDLIERLEALSPTQIDQLPFGVIAFDPDERVTIYNNHESEFSGIDPRRVIGSNLFTEVAPCTNNYLVAERYRANDHLDERLSYVFTLRMRPTPVELRLLARPGASSRYMIVVRVESV